MTAKKSKRTPADNTSALGSSGALYYCATCQQAVNPESCVIVMGPIHRDPESQELRSDLMRYHFECHDQMEKAQSRRPGNAK